MPRTIWQYPRRRKTYIGDTVRGDLVVGTGSRLGKLPVWQNYDNGWIQLNADNDPVDYTITRIDHDSARISWQTDIDQRSVRIVYDAGAGSTSVTLAPALGTYSLVGLRANTVYTVNLIAFMSWGAWTPDSIQQFTTSVAPNPGSVSGLHYTDRDNHSITLAWDPAARATGYQVFQAVGTGTFKRLASLAGRTYRVTRLAQDTRYQFRVHAVNDQGRSGPWSNLVRSATGHDAVIRTGSVDALVLAPYRTGSWREDISWEYWVGWPGGGWNYDVYQGQWVPGHRYWGVIEYSPAALRARIDDRFGAGVADSLRVTSARLKRVSRRPRPGTGAGVELHWHLTNCHVRASNTKPPNYLQHVNDHTSADASVSQRSIRRGQTIPMLRIPRSWAQALIRGKIGGTVVNGLLLHRADTTWNGYGYAGYSALCQQDDGSDFSLVIAGNWRAVIRDRVPPRDW